jgi:hypothetical protein
MRPASVVAAAAAAALLREWALFGRSVIVKLKYFQTMLFAAVLGEQKIRISFLKTMKMQQFLKYHGKKNEKRLYSDDRSVAM